LISVIEKQYAYDLFPLCYRFSVKNDLKWCCTYLLDATDSLFIEIGKAFIEKQLQGGQSCWHNKMLTEIVLYKYPDTNLIVCDVFYYVFTQSMEEPAIYITGKSFFTRLF